MRFVYSFLIRCQSNNWKNHLKRHLRSGRWNGENRQWFTTGSGTGFVCILFSFDHTLKQSNPEIYQEWKYCANKLLSLQAITYLRNHVTCKNHHTRNSEPCIKKVLFLKKKYSSRKVNTLQSHQVIELRFLWN